MLQHTRSRFQNYHGEEERFVTQPTTDLEFDSNKKECDKAHRKALAQVNLPVKPTIPRELKTPPLPCSQIEETP